jgi:hypothetical protein
MNTEEIEQVKYSIDDINACWSTYGLHYLVDILNGEYKVEDAKEDLKSLIGTEWDKRAK